jgi:predicted transposase/invertase (TIGR01784 family)
MSIFIDPLTDFGLKRIFANEEHKNITMDFLNAILKLENPIVSIEFQNLEKGGYAESEKKAIFDIFAKDSENREIIVELQRIDQTYFIDRSLFYTSKQIVNMGVKGSWAYELRPIYFVGILDFKHFSDERYIRYVSCKDEENLEVYKKLQLVYIEIPKFQKPTENLEEFEKWIFFLKNLVELKERVFKSESFEDAFEIAYFSNLKGDERLRYEIDLKERRDRYAIETTRERRLEEARKDGIEKGRLEGIVEGRAEGRAEGEKRKQLEIAQNLLKSGMEIEMISKVTGLSKTEIEGV